MDKQNEKDYLEKLRHSTAHLLAAAVMELWPDTKRAIGPPIENGFYYDFEFIKPISESDLPRIEKQMHKIVNNWTSVKKLLLSSKEAKKKEPNNPYKQELIDEFSQNGKKKVSFYKSGDFFDLCKGGHLSNPKKVIKYFKLLSVAGAYWRGSEKNKMLTRIYGTVFPTKLELDDHLKRLEEAKTRDHKLLGKELDLFIINDNIGKGLPLLTPKGTIIRNEILNYERELERKADFSEVWSSHIAKNDLYKLTGHWDHYRDVMYEPFGIDDETYVLKPMNCPHHYMIYSSKPRSYKDLPIRLSEPGTCYRYEKSGELGGLTRVRALSIDDSHIFMTEDQIDSEFKTCINMVTKMFKAFKLKEYWVRLSLNDPADHVKYIADANTWKKAGKKLEEIVKKNNLKYEVGDGEASFYGPKIDFMVKDAIGREWQMSTLQLDLFMAKRLGLVYTDKDGKDKNPIILHRGLTGSLERTIGILIEHFAGAFPIWLAPIQVVIIPISQDQSSYAQQILTKLKENNIRTENWNQSENMQKKIRNAEKQKVPYMLIVGRKEQEKNTISVRQRGEKDLGSMTLEKFLAKASSQIDSKAIL